MDQADIAEHPRARGSLAGSEDALITPAAPRRSTNRALKVAGLTTLACLLVASQVFTAYMVFNQKQQINSLQKDSEKMVRQLTRSAPAVSRVRIPMGSMPLLTDFSLDEASSTPDPQPKTKCQLKSSLPSKFGSYKPQCDDQGRYLPAQCWSSVGFCWCVDEDGNPIEGTNVRGRPKCSKDSSGSLPTSSLTLETLSTDGR